MLTSILQPSHLIIVLIAALVILGPKRLPEAGRALGQGLKDFKASISSAHDDDAQLAPVPAVTDEDNAQRQVTPASRVDAYGN